MLSQGYCCSRMLRFWYHCWNHIVESFAKVGSYIGTWFCSHLCPFANKNIRYIGKSIVYYNTVLCSIFLLTIWKLQICQSYLVHYIIVTYSFDVIILILLVFISGIGYNNICSFNEIIQLWRLNSDYKRKVMR